MLHRIFIIICFLSCSYFSFAQWPDFEITPVGLWFENEIPGTTFEGEFGIVNHDDIAYIVSIKDWDRSWITDISPRSIAILPDETEYFTISGVFPQNEDAEMIWCHYDDGTYQGDFGGPWIYVVPYIDTEAPTAPSNLRITNSGNTTISIAWDASTDNVGVTYYHIYNFGVHFQKVSGSTTTRTYSGLPTCTQYSFSVKAEDGSGNVSDPSNTVSIATKLEVDELIYDYAISDNVFVKRANIAIHLLPDFHYTAIDANSLCKFSIGCETLLKSSIINELNEGPSNDSMTEEGTSTLFEGTINITNDFGDKLRIYPNPTNGFFTISGLNACVGSLIEVRNLMGKLILNIDAQAYEEMIDISDQPNGIYFVRIISQGQVTMKRIVKQ